jgi:hypothetical protein
LILVEIDNEKVLSDVFSVFSPPSRSASTSSGKSLQHVSSKNAGARKLCALLHQIENRFFSFAADDGQAAQIDY